MGLLPVERLQPYVRPFTYVGVDLAGPFRISVGRRSEKRWICLFTCLTTRAVHLEIAKDLSTEAALMCIDNLTNRRGLPVTLRSDQGTNFIGALAALTKACLDKGIDWKFNTPKDAAAGGAWERLILIPKKTLEVALKDRAPQLETFQCAQIEAENMINSRPLIDVPVGSEEADPITPNHFLLGGSSFIPTPSPTTKICLRGQWNLKKAIMESAWKTWKTQ